MIDSQLQSCLANMKEQGWRITTRPIVNSLGSVAALPIEVRDRYPHIPDEYINFLDRVELCIDGTDTAWFLCLNDFNERIDGDFSWNHWEKLSLEAAMADHDIEWADKIRSFWDIHLPIAMSVRNEYSYLALSLSKNIFGQVVYGYEPEFEETKILCLSFSELMVLITEHYRGNQNSFSLEDFL